MSSIFLTSVEKYDIQKAINSLKNGRSSGIDNISSYLVKRVFGGKTYVLI